MVSAMEKHTKVVLAGNIVAINKQELKVTIQIILLTRYIARCQLGNFDTL